MLTLKRTALILLFIGMISSALGSTPADHTRYFSLNNRMQVYLVELHNLPLLHVVFAFNVGSKDESDETSGLSHLLEHYFLFQGTQAQTPDRISSVIRQHGGYFNAHTSRDTTIFELSIPAEYADFALENQKEILFHRKIKQEDLDREKPIIMEEILQTKDDPIRYGLSLLYRSLFPGHSYNKPIYGKKDIIQSLSAEQANQYCRKYFVPENCALAVVGDFHLQEMEERVRQYFRGIQDTGFSPEEFPMAPSLKKDIEIQKTLDIHKAYMLIGTAGPDYNNPDQYAVDVLTQILGRGINPMVYSALRGRRRLVDSAFMNYNGLRYGGVIHIELTLDQKNIRPAKKETLKFFKQTRKLNYSKKDYYGDEEFYALDFLQNALNQIRFNFYTSQENGLNIAASLARYMLLNKMPDRRKYLDAVEQIKSTDLRKAAGHYLSKGKYAVIILKPLKK